MIKAINRKFLPLIIFFGILILLLVGLFFFITFNVSTLKTINNQIIHFIREDDFEKAFILIDEIDLNKKNSIFLQKLSFIPFVKKEFELSQCLVAIKKDLKEINNGAFLSTMLQQQEDSLFSLKNLKNNLDCLKKYDLNWVEKQKYQLENWLSFLGEEKERNYLVLFQDSDIPRPSGGFIGAYAFLSFDNGRIDFSGNNIFALEKVFLKNIVPPIPLQDIGDKWFFHDANWFFDFSLTSQKILSFYKQTEMEPDLDGIILVNSSVVESVLEITEPIKISEHNLTIDQTNFLSFYKNQIQEAVKPAPLREEKELLSLFFNEFQESLKKASIEKLALISQVLTKAFDKKEIQIYVIDDNLEYFFNSFDWTGKIKESKNDYLGVNFSFINEGFIEDSRVKMIKLKTEFVSNGEIINYLTINAPNFSAEEKLLENYIKIYLPKGIIVKEVAGGYLKKNYNLTQLENLYDQLGYTKDEDLLLIEKSTIQDEKNGIEIYEEGGKIVIGLWAQLSLKPLNLVYKLPEDWRQLSDWEIVTQKQSGQNVKFSFELLTPKNISIVPSLFPFNQFIPLDKDLTLNFKREN